MLTYACLVRGCSLSEELERDGEREREGRRGSWDGEQAKVDIPGPAGGS